MKKRIISLLLVALMLFSLMPTAAFAAEGDDDLIVDTSTVIGRLISHIFSSGEGQEDAKFSFIIHLLDRIVSLFNAGSKWETDSENHWKENIFGTVKNKGPHEFVQTDTEPTCTTGGEHTKKCSVCGYAEYDVQYAALGHEIIRVERKEPVGTEEGMMAHYECTRCHKYYTDAAGTKEISKSVLIIPAPIETVEKLSDTTIVSGTAEEPAEYMLAEDNEVKGKLELNASNVVIDLGGKEIKAESLVLDGDNVVIKDGTIDGEVLLNGDNVVIKDSTIDGKLLINYPTGSQTTTLEGVVIGTAPVTDSKDKQPALLLAGAKDKGNESADGLLCVYSGVLNLINCRIAADSANPIIQTCGTGECKISISGENGSYTASSQSVFVDGQNAQYVISISAGTFNKIDSLQNTGTISVTGGKFTAENPEQASCGGGATRNCVAEGYSASGDGPWTVVDHVHTYQSTWTSDATGHWHASACGHESEISDKAAHTFGDWSVTEQPTCTEKGTKTRECSICGFKESADVAATGHSFSTELVTTDDTYHWKAATCGHTTEVSEKAEHTWSEWQETTPATCTDGGVGSRYCTVCGKTQTNVGIPAGHKFASTWTKMETHHWYAATCGHTTEKKDYGEHDFGEWTTITQPTCETQGSKTRVCATCQYVETAAIDALGHDYDTTWYSDGTNHYHACTRNGCTSKSGTAAHSGGTAKCNALAECTVCGQSYGSYASHTLTPHVVVPATCDDNGTIEYWSCSVCTKNFKQSDGTDEVSSTIDPAKGHKYGETWESDGAGNHFKTCANDNSHKVTEACKNSSGGTTGTCKDCGYVFPIPVSSVAELSAMESGKNYILTQDITTSTSANGVSISASNVSLDLGGKSISFDYSTGNYIGLLIEGNNVTIKDSGATKATIKCTDTNVRVIRVTGTNCKINGIQVMTGKIGVIADGGTVTLENCTITSTFPTNVSNANNGCVQAASGGIATINSGTYTAKYSTSSNHTASSPKVVCAAGNGTVIINGGTFRGANNDGGLIWGGTITDNPGVIKIYGGDFNGACVGLRSQGEDTTKRDQRYIYENHDFTNKYVWITTVDDVVTVTKTQQKD